jgi:hypothetical protein
VIQIVLIPETAEQVQLAIDLAAEFYQFKSAAAEEAEPEHSAPPAPPPPPPPPAAEAAAAAAPAVTLEQVRAKLAAISQAGKRAEAKALLDSFGVAKLTDLSADRYADLLAAAEAL